MSPGNDTRMLRNIALIALLMTLVVDVARATPADCMQTDTNAAATILGVPAVRVNVNNYGQHTKMSPDNMDLLVCGYYEASRAQFVRTLLYSIYTPVPKDLANMYANLSQIGNFPGAKSFAPHVGSQSTGWYRVEPLSTVFEGYVAMLAGPTIVTIKIAGMPTAAAVQTALVNAAKPYSKH